jgi:hypothetical protein
MPGGHTIGSHRLERRSLKVVEHLGGNIVQRRAQRVDRVTEGSIKLCQEGIEKVKRVHRRTLF